MIREFMVNDSCFLITFDRALFLREGDVLRLEGTRPVIERLDGRTVRPSHKVCTVRWAYKLL